MGDEIQANPEEATTRLSRKKFIGGVAGAGIGLGLAGVLAACGGGGDGGTEAAATTAPGQETANNAAPIVIGKAHPVVNSPADADQMKWGSGLAVQEINDAGGIGGRSLEEEIVDMNSFDAETITAAFNDLVSKEVDVVLTGYTNVQDPNVILAAYGAPYLNASTSNDQVTQLKSDPKFNNIFQVDPTEVPYGTGFPPFLEGLIAQGLFNPPAKKIHIIEGDIVYGQTISKACQDAAPAAGWEIVGVDPVDTGGGANPITDWTPFFGKVKDSGATVVFNTHWNPTDHAAFMKAWVADPADALVYLQYGASLPEFLELAGDAANGAIWATVLGLMADPVGQGFKDRFNAKWGEFPGFSNAGTGYDEVYLIAHAWGITGDSRNFPAVIAELERNIYRGVAGGYWFGHDDTAHYCLSYPAEVADPSLGNPHLFYQIQPDDSGALSHQIIQPVPYVQATYQKPAWLSF